MAESPQRIVGEFGDRRVKALAFAAALACLAILGLSQMFPRPLRIDRAHPTREELRAASPAEGPFSWELHNWMWPVDRTCDCWRDPSCCKAVDWAILFGGPGAPWENPLIEFCYPSDRFDRGGTHFRPAYAPLSGRRYLGAAAVEPARDVEILRIVASSGHAERLLERMPHHALSTCHARALFDHPNQTLRLELSRQRDSNGAFEDTVRILPRRVRDPRVHCCFEQASGTLFTSADPPFRIELRLVPRRRPASKSAETREQGATDGDTTAAARTRPE